MAEISEKRSFRLRRSLTYSMKLKHCSCLSFIAIFTFISRRHRGTPFGLTFYIDSMQDIRLSSCCEYKHKPGHILGGKNGHFQFVNVEGAAPCYR